jgi:hypothetical protein
MFLTERVVYMLVKTSMAELKRFNTPDEVRTFPKGKLELVKIGGPQSGAPYLSRDGGGLHPCNHWQRQKLWLHFQYHISGTIMVLMDDGTQQCKAGDVSLPTGHDAWVVGNEPAVIVDFQGMVDYAKETIGNK